MKLKIITEFTLLSLFLSGCLSFQTKITPISTLDSANENNGQLLLIITLEKNKYHLGEQIRPNLRLQNLGSRGVLIRNKFTPGYDANEHHVNIEEIFIGPNHKPVDLSGTMVRFLPSSEMEFNSEFQILEGMKEFSRTFGNLGFNYNINQVGKYSYQIKYKNHFDPSDGRIAWKGILTSNVIEFEIVP